MEVDVDCISDGETTVIGAIMEHIEQAGIHSGDSACVIPTFSLTKTVLAEISSATKAMARELNVRGLMNVQFAVKGEDVYVLEVNPRASRTVPFVSKAIGVPLAKLAAKVMAGKTLSELGFIKEIVPKHFSVKEAVFPFLRYQGQDISLGPEMKSTGEVMGIDHDLGLAYAKSQMAAPPPLPKSGNVFVSVKDSDKTSVVSVVREFVTLGFGIIATSGTATALEAARVPVTRVFKIREGRPNVLAAALVVVSINAEEKKPMSSANEVAVVKTSEGEMIAEFWPDVAPNTVENFKKLARSGFYDGTAFHRIVKGFMIQGGDPLTKDPAKESRYGTGDPGYKIKAEFNDRSHERGVLCMARSSDPDSAGRQFFICLAHVSRLDHQYTTFGKIIKGDDVLGKIGDTEVTMSDSGERSKPTKRVTVESIKIVPADSVK